MEKTDFSDIKWLTPKAIKRGNEQILQSEEWNKIKFLGIKQIKLKEFKHQKYKWNKYIFFFFFREKKF